jgi:hypothetical protein
MAPTYTFHELREKNVHELREIAKSLEAHDAVRGYTQLNKEHLLQALAKALNLPTHEHHAEGGFDKNRIKTQMRALRQQRDAALASGDSEQLHAIRRQLHRLNHEVRRHTIEE